ncbi:hypothetical protein [Azospirillum sp. TSO22-1]|uniref:hypothetical protein n=1 Tax=Azospirillum sp. TSO22-1 TaxID=716789 RepID=UPI000D60ED8E|nr:hypothetical protein [Azospirillum sp. TSO22-1]PWC44284.1 hypothetical protein TSO221_18500 [Azospirillum sp. TSO22-1]
MIGKHAALAAELNHKHEERMAKLQMLHGVGQPPPAPATKRKRKPKNASPAEHTPRAGGAGTLG